MRNTTKKIIMASVFAAICCIATMIIKIPSPLKGYINIGDCIVLVAGFFLSPLYGFLSAGIGSAMADIFSGYVIYAPATFLIKGLMAYIAHLIFKLTNKRMSKTTSRIIAALIAELFMAAGYLTFEGFLYGFAASAVNIPANAIQGTAGLILGVILAGILSKHKLNI